VVRKNTARAANAQRAKPARRSIWIERAHGGNVSARGGTRGAQARPPPRASAPDSLALLSHCVPCACGCRNGSAAVPPRALAQDWGGAAAVCGSDGIVGGIVGGASGGLKASNSEPAILAIGACGEGRGRATVGARSAPLAAHAAARRAIVGCMFCAMAAMFGCGGGPGAGAGAGAGATATAGGGGATGAGAAAATSAGGGCGIVGSSAAFLACCWATAAAAAAVAAAAVAAAAAAACCTLAGSAGAAAAAAWCVAARAGRA